MSGKREINGVFMIPFGLVAGFADGQEIRITEIAEHGFCFRTLDEFREVKRFRICFYDRFNGMKTGDQEKKSRDPYTEVEIHSFEMEVRVEDGLGIPVYVYSVFVEQEKYRECAGSLILWYDRFVRLKLECEDGELAMALTGYPAKKDEQFAENFIEQKKEWFGEGEDRARQEKRNTGSYCCGDFTESKRNDFEDRMTVEKRIENQSGIRENCIAAGDFELKEYKEHKEYKEYKEQADHSFLYQIFPVRTQNVHRLCLAAHQILILFHNVIRNGMVSIPKLHDQFFIAVFCILINHRSPPPSSYPFGSARLLLPHSFSSLPYQ